MNLLTLVHCVSYIFGAPLPAVIFIFPQILFSEQIKLRNAISGNSSKKTRDLDGNSYGPSARDHSQIGGQSTALCLDDSEADGLSLHESWLAARQDIKYLKQEMERMKAKYAHLEYENLAQQVTKLISLPHTSQEFHLLIPRAPSRMLI